MNNEIAQALLTAAVYEMSATALAQKIGKSKAYMVQDEIDQLVAEGKLIKNDSGRFVTYKAAPQRVAVRTQTASVVEDSSASQDQELPAGYKVKKNSRGQIQKVQRKINGETVTGMNITTRTGDTYFVKDGSNLVVINDEAVGTVKTPAAAINAIARYAESHNMTAYTVRQNDNSAARATDIRSQCGVIDVKVVKNNKAA